MKKVISSAVFFLATTLFLVPAYGNAVVRFSDSSPLVALAEKAAPAVVFVAVEDNSFDRSYALNKESYYQSFPSIFELIRPIYESFWPPEYSHGSGFFVSSDGYIVTNWHVVGAASRVLVSLQGEEKMIWEADVIGVDLRTDLAVLKIIADNGKRFPYLEFGDSRNIRVGEQVVAIGNPLAPQLERTLTAGIISGLDRNRFSRVSIEGFIQTDTPVNGGNSGGPLLTVDGKVIGIIDWGVSEFDSGLNFAIPSHTAKLVVDQLIKSGRVIQGFLGIELAQNAENAFDCYFFSAHRGALIEGVLEDTPASWAGLREGDYIVALNGNAIRSQESLRNYMYVLGPRTIIDLTIEREGYTRSLSIELEENEQASLYFFLNYLQGQNLVL